jgi:DNA-binding NtrC family response regulator
MAIYREDPNIGSTSSSLPGQRILLVDEDANDLKYFTMLLELMDYSVWAFANYREAKKCLADGYFDLVIVSQEAPSLETHRLVEFTLGRERYTPVVVLARCLDVKSYLQAMQLGASDYLEKPLTPSEFERVVVTYCPPRQREMSAGT